MDRTLLIECFKDTQRRVKEDAALAEATRRAQAGTRLYLPGFDAVLHPSKSSNAAIDVVEDTTFHCAQSLADGKQRVAVLNFANPFHPGGGVAYGAMAQEECLCRSSNLYSALTLPYNVQNYYKHNANSVGDLGTDAVIYTPDVVVFKSDDALPEHLVLPFKVDVLTCAAPLIRAERKKSISPEELSELVTRRIRNILEVAAANDVDALVLGAFGCGAFNNPPDVVASCFRYLLRECRYADCFLRVIFAIKAAPAPNINFTTFHRILAS